MSLTAKCQTEVKLFMDSNKNAMTDEAKYRIRANLRTKGTILPDDAEVNALIQRELQVMEMEMYNATFHEHATKIFKDAIDVFNTTDHDGIKTAFMEAITTTHRQIQSDFWLRMSHLMVAYSQLDKQFFDGRNEYWKNGCREMGMVTTR